MFRQYKDFTPFTAGSFQNTDIFPFQRDLGAGLFQNQKITVTQFRDTLLELLGGVLWYNVIADLKLETFLSEKVLYLTKGDPATFENSADYYYDSASLAVPNDFSVVLPFGKLIGDPGRFIQRSA